MKLNLNLVLCIICQIWSIKVQQGTGYEFDPIDYMSDFKTLTKLPNFVDKTDLLPLLITNATNHTFHIFTAPRKFGKSTIIDMIRRFVELPINSTTGEIINKTRTTNYNMFTDTQLNLSISRNSEFIQQHMGEYPVLLVNFTDVKGDTLEDQMRYFKAALQKTARKYAWLYWTYMKNPIEKTNDTDEVVKKLRLEGMGRLITGEASDAELVDGLQDISRSIFDYYGKEPFVLIDSFDTPMQQASRRNIYEVENVTRFVNDLLFMGMRFGPFITHHMVATGISGSFAKIAAQETLMQTPRFLEQSPFLPYFGLTSSEVDKLLSEKNIQEEERLQIDLHYNGYVSKYSPEDPNAEKISNQNSTEAPNAEEIDNKNITEAPNAEKIYNIFSVLKYLRERAKTGKPNYLNYWQRTDTMKGLNFYLSAPAIRGMLYSLILRKSLTLQSNLFTYAELEQLKEFKNNENPFQTDQGLLYFIYFIEHGYLARKDVQNDRNRYHIVNLDAEFEIIEIINSFYQTNNLQLNPIAEHFVKLLEQGTYPANLLEQLKADVKKIVEKSPDANRLSFQCLLFCAARLRYPLTTTRLLNVNELATYTNVTETKTVDIIVQNDQRDVLHLYCVKNRQILDAILIEAKQAYPQDYETVQGRQNKVLGIYLGEHNSIDFEIVG
ncbi:uncharacterized protein LOC135833189 [Planococcus citri]|uniref:uncharacterized protein LOC135833189 n=1 Tax=Planococcus citri TaxID=170843 RepID=UPI0031F8C6E1